jgi:peptidoglycan/LPS O-acetylase OafA/YrhL
MTSKQPPTNRAIWLDYLRAFITVLVVAHHSSLAYTTFASFNKAAYNASTHPIVDTVRSHGLDIFEDFNGVFFMSLMFLISGIFVLPALASSSSCPRPISCPPGPPQCPRSSPNHLNLPNKLKL